MYACVCGFTCGIPSALDKHISRASQTAVHKPTKFTREIRSLQAVYDGLDRDGDRRLSFEEMSELLRKGDPNLSHEELTKLYNGVDKNNDGYINFDEFVEYLFVQHDKEVAITASTSESTGTGADDPVTPKKDNKRGLSVTVDLSTEAPSSPSRFVEWESPMGQSFNSADTLSSPAKSVNLEGAQIRLLLVRHAKSANKAKAKGSVADLDPKLAEEGFEQAEALGRRLSKELGRRNGSILVASSPMQRCLQTILPTVTRLELSPGDCIVHGACYEFGCAGKNYRGSSQDDIQGMYPDFEPVGFSADGHWDYTGDSDRETPSEACERADRIVSWIWSTAATLSSRMPNGRHHRKTFLLCIHQTMADLICQLLIDGTSANWTYGEVKYRLQNTAITEVILEGDSKATWGVRNDGSHALGVREEIWKKSSLTPKDYAPASSGSAAHMFILMRKYFKRLDTSGDGRLDFNEISSLLRYGDPSLTDDECWNLFNAADKRNRGAIDYREFVEYLFEGHKEDRLESLLST